MLIYLQEPFKSIWKQGYLQVHPNGRKYICLVNSPTDRTIISNARYVMSVYNGEIVPDGLEVDHRDDDKTNDEISNLQIVTAEFNRLKEQFRYVMSEQNIFGFHCAWCGIAFALTERLVNQRLKCSKSGLAFCCKKCSELYQKQVEGLSQDVINQIQYLRKQGLSGYEISDQLQIARSTVMKYW